jgi:hypothetical protein
MFDIREYYYSNTGKGQNIDNTISGIDDELVTDIDSLLLDRVGTLYLCDRYKNNDSIIEIIYPGTGYPGMQSLILSPDRIRFLLSFYPYKGDFSRVSKIVLRPRYFEAGNIELAAVYLKKRKVLVLYLTHPFNLSENSDNGSRFVSVNLENIMDSKVIEDSIDRSGKPGGKIPYLWHVLSVISPEGETGMEKFFIRIDRVDPKIYNTLNDISHFYYRHGY